MRNWRSPQISKNSTDLPLNTKPSNQPRSALKSEGKHYFEPHSEVQFILVQNTATSHSILLIPLENMQYLISR